MRVDTHTEGSILHVVKRGARGALIVQDEQDYKHFLQCLYYLNDEYRDENWQIAVGNLSFLSRPSHYPPQKPIVDVLAWTLMPNHFHLILREIQEGGIAVFMQRLSGSMSMRANTKYQESGSLFQGSYKGRLVEDDADLRWLASYVMVKNTLELYPGGLAKAKKDFERAWQWGISYQFSSMGCYARKSSSPILATVNNVLRELFKNGSEFKKDSHDMLMTYIEKKESGAHNALTLE